MSKIKTNIRRKISQELDILIPEGKWEQYLEELDKEGIPNRKQLISIILIICQQVETLENFVEDIYSQIEKPVGAPNASKTAKVA